MKNNNSNEKKTINVKPFKICSVVLSYVFIVILVISLVLTQNGFLSDTLSLVLGGERQGLVKGEYDQYVRYDTEYKTKKDVLEAAEKMNDKICDEGIILLKNENNALPLSEGAKVTVLGRNSIDIVHGGSGSNKGNVKTSTNDVNDSLIKAGFEVNTTVRDFYKAQGVKREDIPMGTVLTGYPIYETPVEKYTQEVKNSFSNYNDAAIVVITRFGGEGFDLPRTMFWDGKNLDNWNNTSPDAIPGAKSKDSHYLELDENEKDVLNMAYENFDKVVLVVNSASPVEIGFLNDTTNELYNEKLSSAFWLGHPGANGVNSLGKLLKGEVNPSGRTVDIFAKDFTLDPTWFNFGNNAPMDPTNSMKGDAARYYNDGSAKNAWFVEYREGIYMGYRYYETQCAERNNAESGTGNEWYNNNVVFPFGYGMSYTTFEWTVTNSNGTTFDRTNNTLNFDVTVKNTGSVAGKDVIQLYYTAPYVAGQIEKAHVVLGDFVKTDLLQPNESKTYKLSINARQMASYDYNDANSNGFKGYELDSGKYTISIMKNSHEVVKAYNYQLNENIQYPNSTVNTDYQIKNLFDDVSEHINEYLSRQNSFANFDCIKGSHEESYRTVTKDFMKTWTYGKKGKADDKPEDPWYTETMPNQAKTELKANEIKIRLSDMFGVDYNDPKWDEFMDQLTVKQMRDLISKAGYKTIAMETIDKPNTLDCDGPMGIVAFMGDKSVYDTYYYASEALLAATWNVELSKEYGEMVGDEALVGNIDGDGRPYSGIYSPAMNTHRSPFAGRNFEYYSEDPLIAGKMAQAYVGSLRTKGVYTMAKHFALNDQETKRDDTGLFTWSNEQSMREIYLRPFEITVKEGKTTGIMTSFNRIGVEWAGGSYRLLTEILRKDWGFNGMIITDFNLKNYMSVDQMIRAGGSINLSADKGPLHIDDALAGKNELTATDVSCLRKACKDALYIIGNSCAMNRHGPDNVWAKLPPVWNSYLWIATGVTAGLAVISFVLGLIFAILNQKNDKENNGQDILKYVISYLCYIVPLLGFVMFALTLKKDKQQAKSYLIGGIVSTIIYLILIIALAVVFNVVLPTMQS